MLFLFLLFSLEYTFFFGSAYFIIVKRVQYKKNEEIEKKIEEKLQENIFKDNIYDAIEN